jgi:diacylglycerol kinase
MRRYARSAGYALQGLRSALHAEHNLKLFIIGYGCSLLAGLWLPAVVPPVSPLRPDEWMFLLLSGGTFLAVEVLNTAIERFTDAFNAHTRLQKDDHDGTVGMTKDIAAGAALLSALTWIAILAFIFAPRLLVLCLLWSGETF